MIAYEAKKALAASALILGAFGVPAAAQVVSGGTSGSTPSGQNVTASTCGSGQTDGTNVAVQGCAAANAANGGTADTSYQAKANQEIARQRAVATATDADARARSRTQTMVHNGQVRSRTMSIYHQRGQKPVIERSSTVNGTPR